MNKALDYETSHFEGYSAHLFWLYGDIFLGFKVRVHHAGRALTSDWSVHSFTMAIYEKRNFSLASDRKKYYRKQL